MTSEEFIRDRLCQVAEGFEERHREYAGAARVETEHDIARGQVAIGAAYRKCAETVRSAIDELASVADGAPGSEPAPSEPRYALVEQMGYRQVFGTVREVQFVGKPMLEVTALDTGSTRLVGADGIYQLTWLTKNQAESATRTGAHSVAAIAAASAEEFASAEDEDPNVQHWQDWQAAQ